MFLLSKLKLLFEVIRQGKEVANPEFWKRVQSEGQPVLASFLVSVVALLKGTPYEFPLDDYTAASIAGVAFSISNWWLTKATSKKVGLAPIEDHSSN